MNVLIAANEYFFSIKFVAQILQMDTQVLLDLLDSVQVILDPAQLSAKGMPKTLDIGLNLIRRRERKIVPNLVRLPHTGTKVNNLFKAFYDLQISVDAVNLLFEYQKEYPEIFDYMEWRTANLIAKSKDSGLNPNWKEEIHAGNIYPEDKDPNVPVTRVYVWLLKKDEIHYPAASMNSKKISKAKIASIVNYFK